MDILLADDDIITRSLIKKMLETLGHRVVEAEDGLKAWELIRKNNLRIVITDWMMPGMDGVKLCETIRKRQNSSYVFIILLTAKNELDDIIRGLEAGADDYLCKPFHQTELIARLNSGIRIIELESSLQKAYQEIKRLSIIDELTGCFNVRYLNEQLLPEIKRAGRYGQPIAFVLCDIDHFKKVNDTYGHPAGDQILKTFANRMQESVRNSIDWVARYGGEEFAVVLPNTDIKGGCILAERLRTAADQKMFEVNGTQLHVTASFGITGFEPDTPDAGSSPAVLMKYADEYLYQAKAQGRNRVICGPVGDC